MGPLVPVVLNPRFSPVSPSVGLFPEKLQTQRVHLLLAADTGDEIIGEGVGIDIRNMEEIFREYIPDPRQLTVKTIGGKELTRDNILNSIAQIQPAATDVIVFIFSGHGCHNDTGHFLGMDSGRVARMTAILLEPHGAAYRNGTSRSRETESVFPLARIRELRAQAEKARSIPAGIPNGWSINSIDAMQVVKVFDCLQIKKGIILCGYLYNETILGYGQIWAMPTDAPFPEPDSSSASPPKPSGALDHVMEGITGDGSPWSYLCASILSRELAEFGARWHGCNWTTHTLIGANLLDPDIRAEPRRSDDTLGGYSKGELLKGAEKDWKWLLPEPTQWQPSVRVGSESVMVIFYTYSPLGFEGIYQHTDTYVPGRYRAKTQVAKIAEGRRYMVF